VGLSPDNPPIFQAKSTAENALSNDFARFSAASRARAASTALPTIFLATVGFCSKKSPSFRSETIQPRLSHLN
jgi:hypothetical protein